MYEIGAELSVQEKFYKHVSAYIGDGYVFHNHPERGEEVTTVGGFSQGRPVSVTKGGVADQFGFFQRVNAAVANPSNYDIFLGNCEHTVSKLRTGVSSSPQVLFWGLVAFAGIASVAALRLK